MRSSEPRESEVTRAAFLKGALGTVVTGAVAVLWPGAPPAWATGERRGTTDAPCCETCSPSNCASNNRCPRGVHRYSCTGCAESGVEYCVPNQACARFCLITCPCP